jgi:hypothetical protein
MKMAAHLQKLAHRSIAKTRQRKLDEARPEDHAPHGEALSVE